MNRQRRRICAGMLVSLGRGWTPLGKDGVFEPTSPFSHAGTLEFEGGEVYLVQLHPDTAERIYGLKTRLAGDGANDGGRAA